MISKETTVDFQFIIFYHEVSHAYLCQLVDLFSYHLQFDGYEAWEVFVANVQQLTRYYRVHHARL